MGSDWPSVYPGHQDHAVFLLQSVGLDCEVWFWLLLYHQWDESIGLVSYVFGLQFFHLYNDSFTPRKTPWTYLQFFWFILLLSTNVATALREEYLLLDPHSILFSRKRGVHGLGKFPRLAAPRIFLALGFEGPEVNKDSTSIFLFLPWLLFAISLFRESHWLNIAEGTIKDNHHDSFYLAHLTNIY